MTEIDADHLAVRYLSTSRANQLTVLTFAGPSRLANALRTASTEAKQAVAKTMKPWEQDVFTEPLVSTPRPAEEESSYRSLLRALIDALEAGSCAPLPQSIDSED